MNKNEYSEWFFSSRRRHTRYWSDWSSDVCSSDPWFSSGIEIVNHRLQPLFQALYDNGVEVLLTGHDHGYERFAPMDAAANRDGARGVRQFVVGTGGKNETMRRFPDRKSTRLNSSHANISYADFCLKKKRQQVHNYYA